ncbi:MAG: SDR family NAD(P)-dependent oxidoreductase [Syntrophomonadaceae bacterium]|nr:SDR family NAD(P)-dependent oxidoreductase [Syntrophomonadaceae bacterium]
MKFDGKVALVTGGGTGIGKSAAIALAKEGAKVVIVGRRSGPLEETAQEIKAFNGEVLAVPTDVTMVD